MYSDSGGKTTNLLYQFQDNNYRPLPGHYWRNNHKGMDILVDANRVVAVGTIFAWQSTSKVALENGHGMFPSIPLM
jgi:hypothetical protein